MAYLKVQPDSLGWIELTRRVNKWLPAESWTRLREEMEKVSAVIFRTSRPSRVFTVKASSEREKSCSFITSVVGYSAMKGGKTATGEGTGGNCTAAIVCNGIRDVRTQFEAVQGMDMETDEVVQLTIEGVGRRGFLLDSMK